MMNEQTKQEIENLVKNNTCVLFMKGNPKHPQCGFSSNTVNILHELLGDDFAYCNILENQNIREGIKEYGNWPTIPQLYVNKELVGGNDIVTEMYNTGELQTMLGLPQPQKQSAEITITEVALENIKKGIKDIGSNVLMLSIDSQFNTRFSIEEPKGYETVSKIGEINIYMDIGTVKRANGIEIDWVEDLQGAGLVINNPNQPKEINQISKKELINGIEKGQFKNIYDVRSEQQFLEQSIPGSKRLDKQSMDEIESLDKDTPLVIVCAVGNTSQGACNFYRKKGFNNVNNLVGGVSNWFS
ncbi:MAG: Grx4 family monothiol glutaredoxin [Alcanivoracaceae bacterium]|nr:Grx4 family monothiol glutaredoxin [Alcanivoracaceae bacterium]